jgi:hypothetical protein
VPVAEDEVHDEWADLREMLAGDPAPEPPKDAEPDEPEAEEDEALEPVSELEAVVAHLTERIDELSAELADFADYTPLLERGWLRAVAASNVVGFFFDSLLFLWLAFGSLDFLPGQLIGKAWMTAAFVLLLIPLRRSVLAPDAPLPS